MAGTRRLRLSGAFYLGKERRDVSEDGIGTRFVIITLVVVAVLFASAWIGTPMLTDKPGVFGDMFGSVNALFSGLAFVGVIYAILLQRKELQLQRRELESTREEMKLAREEARRSAGAQELTARVSALSQLIQHYREEMKMLQGSSRSPGVREKIDEYHAREIRAVEEIERIYEEDGARPEDEA